MLRDNAGYGGLDHQALAELVYGLQEAGADLELAGLSPEELGHLLDSVAGLDEPEADPEPEDDPATCAACGQKLPT